MKNENNNLEIERMKKDLFVKINFEKAELFTIMANMWQYNMFERTQKYFGNRFIPNLYKLFVSNNDLSLLLYVYYFCMVKYKKFDDIHTLEERRLRNFYSLVYSYVQLDSKTEHRYDIFVQRHFNKSSGIEYNEFIISLDFLFNCTLLNDKSELIIDSSVMSLYLTKIDSDDESNKKFSSLMEFLDVVVRPPVENTILNEMMKFFGNYSKQIGLNDIYKGKPENPNLYTLTHSYICETYLTNFLLPSVIERQISRIKSGELNDDEMDEIIINLLCSYSYLKIYTLLNDIAKKMK